MLEYRFDTIYEIGAAGIALEAMKARKKPKTISPEEEARFQVLRKHLGNVAKVVCPEDNTAAGTASA